MSKIIFVGNYKGGVGKTTTVINLANYMAKNGKKVLTLDLDPQSSLSEIQISKYNYNSNKNIPLIALPDDECLNYVFDLSIKKISKYPSINIEFSDKIIKTLTVSGYHYDFIPSSLFYNHGLGLDALTIKMENTIEYLSILKNYVDTIKSRYDYIIIDCPPSNTLITQSAFLMSDYYLIPTILDKISTNGVVHYIHTVTQIYKEICINNEDAMLAKHFFGDSPKLLGIFFNLIRGQVNYEAEKNTIVTLLKDKKCLPDNLPPHIFDIEVNNRIDISRKTQDGESSLAIDDFDILCKGILTKLENE